MRYIFNIDRRSHRYLLEPLTEQMHPKIMLASRLVTFYRNQLNSSKFRMRFLLRLAADDKRTVLGRTLDKISQECNCSVELLTSRVVKNQLKYAKAPSDEEWRIDVARELYAARKDNGIIPGFSIDDINVLLQHVCVS